MTISHGEQPAPQPAATLAPSAVADAYNAVQRCAKDFRG
jgi:hypothetical protein